MLDKDFIIDRYQLYEAAATGADAILLIVAVLDHDDLDDLHREARGLDLDVPVEVHDEDELTRALDVDADILGINNRDLADFSVRHRAHLRPALGRAGRAPRRVLSSWATARGAARGPRRRRRAAPLVGETLMRADDVEAARRGLVAGHERHFET